MNINMKVDTSILRSVSVWAKTAQLFCLLVAISSFFPLYVLEEQNKSASYFVSVIIVSPFLHTCFLMIAYALGGMVAIQRTMMEVLANAFYTLMLFVASIILFVMSHSDPSAIAPGIFALLASFAYGADTYLSLDTVGILATPESEPSDQPSPEPANQSQPVYSITTPVHQTGTVIVQQRSVQVQQTGSTQVLQAASVQVHAQSVTPRENKRQPFTHPPLYSPPLSLVGAGTLAADNEGFSAASMSGQIHATTVTIERKI